jgi:hypothetical protein
MENQRRKITNDMQKDDKSERVKKMVRKEGKNVREKKLNI